MTRPNPTALLLAGVVLTLAVIGAYLYMSANHMDNAGLLGFVSPIIAGLFIGAKVDSVTGQQNETLTAHSAQLATITKQTNGVLTERIRAGVHEALAQRDAAIAAGAVLATTDSTAPASITTDPVSE